MPRIANPAVRQRWRELFAAFERSGSTVASFCRDRQISSASFYQWRNKLADEEPSQRTRLIPVEVVATGAGRVAASSDAIVVHIDRLATIELPASQAELIVGVAAALAREQLAASAFACGAQEDA